VIAGRKFPPAMTSNGHSGAADVAVAIKQEVDDEDEPLAKALSRNGSTIKKEDLAENVARIKKEDVSENEVQVPVLFILFRPNK
jgi:hypothetical protein